MAESAHPDPALTVALAHEARRHHPLPPLGDLLPENEAMRIVRAEEWRRAAERVAQIVRRELWK